MEKNDGGGREEAKRCERRELCFGHGLIAGLGLTAS